MCGTFCVLEFRSHKLSGVEQLKIDLKKNMIDVTVPKGSAILFSRQLLHNDTANDNNHERFFCFVDIFPKSQEEFIVFLITNETFLHLQPVTNPTRKTRLKNLTKREVRKTGDIECMVGQIRRIFFPKNTYFWSYFSYFVFFVLFKKKYVFFRKLRYLHAY